MVGKPSKFNKPFLKLAGSKYSALPALLPLIPSGRRLIEPFCGTASVALNKKFESYILCDTNGHLVNSYRMLRRSGSQYIEAIRETFDRGNDRDVYISRRKEFNGPDTTPDRRAVLLPYLNRHCYNGLWRVNSTGGFNVPFGNYSEPYFPSDELLGMYRFLTGNDVHLDTTDFRTTMEIARAGDVIYIDPPYVPEATNFRFSPDGFDMDDQADIVVWTNLAVARGAIVVVSNRDCAETRTLYAGASEIHFFDVQQSVSCGNRGKRKELVAIYKPEGGKR